MSEVLYVNNKEILNRSEEDIITNFTYLNVINAVDSFPTDYQRLPLFKKNVFRLQSHEGHDIGFVLRFFVSEMKNCCADSFKKLFDLEDNVNILKFKNLNFGERNSRMDDLSNQLKTKSSLKCIQGWRNEKYPVYIARAPYVLIERALAGAFGIVTYGVHINGYIVDEESGRLKFWIPRRSATKPTWPLMLDNMVAGGIGYPHGVFETVLKECMEEASLSKEHVMENIKSVGIASYFYFNSSMSKNKFENETSFITGEVEYLYDLKLPPDVIPQINDDEVEGFNLFTLHETITAIKNMKFKPNCALVVVDFLIRHGYITPENEPNYMEIVCKIHRLLPFPTRN